MAAVEWTSDQKKVIDLTKRNILVSAAAGSGKTAVLVERILKKIMSEDSKCNIDQLLIVTFTKAAAAEMKERIGKAIEEKMMEEPDNVHLRQQAALLFHAQITTIDSFCLYVIRNYFHTIELDPAFRIADEAELALLQSDVLKEVLEEAYDAQDPKFLEFIECYAGAKSDEPIEELILKLYRFSMSYPYPKQWLLERRDDFKAETMEQLNQTIWMKDLQKRVQELLADCKEMISFAIEISKSIGGPSQYLKALESDLDQIEMISKKQKFEELYEAFLNISFERLSTKKVPDVEDEKKEAVKNLRNQAKDLLKEIGEDYFYQSSDEMLEDMHKTEQPVSVLIELVMTFIDRLKAAKEEANLLDFSDLEHLALEILVTKEGDVIKPTQVANDLSEQFEEIMIDEYQDSNLVQEYILTSISRAYKDQNNLFMVGDVKQSIYKFRLARPELFMEKYDRYTQSDSKEQKVELSKNFRSRGEVLDTVNEIFKKIMIKSLGGIEYTKEVALYVGAKYQEIATQNNKTELILVDTKEDETEEEVNSYDLTTQEFEARAVANQIKELMESDFLVSEKDRLRKIRYSDIVILLRTMSGWSDTYAEQLSQAGIPSFSDTKTGYFQTLEVKTILNFLRILDNPEQDLFMTAVLYSPIGGFTSDDLAKIRNLEKEASMYQCARKGLNCEETRLKEKLNHFFELFDLLRDQIPYLKVHELIQKIYEVTGYDLYALSMPAGEQRKSNLNLLIDHAIKFEQSSYHGLFQFIRYVERLLKYEIDFAEAAGIGENDNAVRIMSIHKSKGLEFPVVFLGAMGKQFNNMDAREKIVFHPDYGIGPECIDVIQRTKVPTLLKKVIQKKLVLDNISEELRILYVALTRAKEKLFMVGCVKDADKEIEKWQQIAGRSTSHLPYSVLAKATNYFSLVGPAIYNSNQIISKKITLPMIKSTEETAQKNLEEKEAKLRSESLRESKDHKVRDLLLSEIEYQYPYQALSKLPVKTTVSELKRVAQKETYEEAELLSELQPKEKEQTIPEFLKEKLPVKGADRGTIIHRIMEEIPFATTRTEEDLRKVIDRLIQKNIIKEEQLSYISMQPILEFLNTDLCDRMRAAEERGELVKEQQFVLGIPAKDLNENFETKDLVLVQGIIDAYFKEGDGYVLLDYKTDYVSDQKEKELIQKYQRQLDLYERAMLSTLKLPVNEKIIYSFYLKKAIGLV